MNDIWLPRLIVAGLILALICVIAETAFTKDPPTWTGYIVTSIISGLLGYVANVVTPNKQFEPAQKIKEKP